MFEAPAATAPEAPDPAGPDDQDPDVIGWSVGDCLAYLEGECASEYRPYGRDQDEDILYLPIA
eukprot:6282037-Lingulodinium_polyedra.AAC.1